MKVLLTIVLVAAAHSLCAQGVCGFVRYEKVVDELPASRKRLAELDHTVATMEDSMLAMNDQLYQFHRCYSGCNWTEAQLETEQARINRLNTAIMAYADSCQKVVIVRTSLLHTTLEIEFRQYVEAFARQQRMEIRAVDAATQLTGNCEDMTLPFLQWLCPPE